jgi:hypothetical protein
MTDYSHVTTRHDQIHYRLESWARWVKVKPQAWKAQALWRMYRAPRQYAYETADIKIELNTLECHETERAVSSLPEKHRTAIRWVYVFSYVPPNIIRRDLGVTRDGLGELITDGRDMLVNKLKQKVTENVAS